MREQDGPKITISNAAVEMEAIDSGTTTTLKISENNVIASNMNDPPHSASLILSPSLIAFDASDNLNLNDTANSTYNLITQSNLNVETTNVNAQQNIPAKMSSHATKPTVSGGDVGVDEANAASSSDPNQIRHDSDSSESEQFFNNFNIKRFSSRRDNND